MLPNMDGSSSDAYILKLCVAEPDLLADLKFPESTDSSDLLTDHCPRQFVYEGAVGKMNTGYNKASSCRLDLFRRPALADISNVAAMPPSRPSTPKPEVAVTKAAASYATTSGVAGEQCQVFTRQYSFRRKVLYKRFQRLQDKVETLRFKNDEFVKRHQELQQKVQALHESTPPPRTIPANLKAHYHPSRSLRPRPIVDRFPNEDSPAPVRSKNIDRLLPPPVVKEMSGRQNNPHHIDCQRSATPRSSSFNDFLTASSMVNANIKRPVRPSSIHQSHNIPSSVLNNGLPFGARNELVLDNIQICGTTGLPSFYC